MKKAKKTKTKKKKLEERGEKISFARTVLLLANCLGGIIFLTLLALYLFVGVNQAQDGSSDAKILVDSSEIIQASLKKNYQRSIITIQEKYLADIKLEAEDLSSYQTRLEAAQTALDEILVLKTPSEWRDLHLDLVLSYDLLTQSTASMISYLGSNDLESEGAISHKNAADSNLQSAISKMDILVLEYSWLESF